MTTSDGSHIINGLITILQGNVDSLDTIGLYSIFNAELTIFVVIDWVVIVNLVLVILDAIGVIFLRMFGKGSGLVRLVHTIRYIVLLISLIVAFAGIAWMIYILAQPVVDLREYSKAFTLTYSALALAGVAILLSYHLAIASIMKTIGIERRTGLIQSVKGNSLPRTSAYLVFLSVISLVIIIALYAISHDLLSYIPGFGTTLEFVKLLNIGFSDKAYLYLIAANVFFLVKYSLVGIVAKRFIQEHKRFRSTVKNQQSTKSKRIRLVTGIIGVIILTMFYLAACSGGLRQEYRPVPNVMGVAHSDAKMVLENAGFKVTEVEADPRSILPYIYYNEMGGLDRFVKKGEIFKVNDNCDPNYSDNEYFRMAPDKNVAIYYAKEDYIPATKPSITENPDADTSITENPDAETSLPDENGVLPTLQKGNRGEDVLNLQQKLVDLGYLSGAPDGDFGKQTVAAIKKFQNDMGLEVTGIADDATQQLILTTISDTEGSDAETSATENPVTTSDAEWKQFLKDYEAWVDGYIKILKKYSDNPSDLTILSDYTNSMQELSEWSERADTIVIDLQDNPAALSEYMSTLSSILIKLSKVEATETEDAEEVTPSKAPLDNDTYTSGEFTYSFLQDGNVKITGYRGNGSSVSIPSEIDGYAVIAIGDSVFKACTDLKSLIIWPDLTSIGNSAFKGCSNLKDISIPSSTTFIGDHVFEDCTSLNTVIIWGDITSIGISAFRGCTELDDVSIPSSCKIIGESAFEGCVDLKSVILWGGETIGNSAFRGCTSLNDISIPSEVTTIGDYAFEGCANLESVIVWGNNTSIGTDAFANCPNLDQIPQ